MTNTNLVAITGNTYPVKDQIKALGGRWNADQKAWMVPADKAEQAQVLVSSAPKPTYKTNYSKYPKTGCRCGSREGIIQNSDCWTCKHDAE